MIIYNYSGKEITERPDYSLGRLIEIEGRVTFVLWDEVPQGTGVAKTAGEPLPTAEEIAAQKKAVAEQEFIATSSTRLNAVEATQDDIVLTLADLLGG